jgi:predicted nucleic acid-binding protein
MTRGTKRFAPDTNIFDEIVGDATILRLVKQLSDRGVIELVVTHIQEDELARIPDSEKRRLMDEVPRTVAPTSDFVVGVSRIGMARLGRGHILEQIRRPNLSKYTNDGLIASTAQFEGAILVTKERRLRNRARALEIDVWGWPEFSSNLLSLAA